MYIFLTLYFFVNLSLNLPLGTSGIQSNPQLASIIGSSVKRVNCVLGIALVKVPAASRDRIKIQHRQRNEGFMIECRTQNYYQERNLDAKVAIALVEAVEDFLSDNPALPKTTDVFVLESLFKPHLKTGQSAIQRAHEELRETPKHIPVAW